MSHKNIILTVAFLAFAMISFGQDYAFKVLVNKGKNEVKVGNSWQPVKTGTSLKSTDELKINENSYVGLVHVTGKPLELKQSGNYKVSDLSAKVGSGSSVLAKYTDFILSANTQKKNTLTATGAVHRGGDNIQVNLPKPEVAIVFNNNVIVNWETDKVPGPYMVTFNSMFGDELKKVETSDNTVAIDLGDKSFANEDNIIVKVASKQEPQKASGDYTLKKLSSADKERIRSSFNEIKADVSDETAFDKFILAGFYEKNNLYIDAITAYEEAIKLAPDVPQYKLDYNDFLIRNGIKEPPVKK